jgi:hypothetical protein
MCSSCSTFSNMGAFIFLFIIVYLIIISMNQSPGGAALAVTFVAFYVLANRDSFSNKLSGYTSYFRAGRGCANCEHFTASPNGPVSPNGPNGPNGPNATPIGPKQEDPSVYAIPYYKKRDPFNRDNYNNNSLNSDDAAFARHQTMAHRNKENALNASTFGRKLSPLYEDLLKGAEDRDWWENY